MKIPKVEDPKLAKLLLFILIAIGGIVLYGH
jgi:hypothetical protein